MLHGHVQPIDRKCSVIVNDKLLHSFGSSFCNLIFTIWNTNDMTMNRPLEPLMAFHIHGVLCFNSLRPSDAIWRHRSPSTLAQVMACCLKVPSGYLTQCWLLIKGVLWYSHENLLKVPINLIWNICSVITLLWLLPHLPWANELMDVSRPYAMWSQSGKNLLSVTDVQIYRMLNNWYTCPGLKRSMQL